MTDSKPQTQGHLAWKSTLSNLDAAAQSLLDAFAASGVSPGQFQAVKILIEDARNKLGGRPADDAVSYATFLGLLVTEHGDRAGDVEGCDGKAQFISSTYGGDGPVYRIDVTQVV